MALAPRAGRQSNTDSPQPLAEDRRAEQERRAEAALLHDFDALFERYEKPLFNFIYQWLGDYDEARI